MAKIVLGLGTAHSPIVSEPAEFWRKHGDFERAHPEPLLEAYGGGEWEELSRQKASWIEKEIDGQTIKQRHEATQKAVAALKEILFKVRPDALVVVGDDQDDVFPHTRYMPAFAIFGGPTVVNVPRDVSKLPDWRASSAWGHYPLEGEEKYPVDAELALQLVKSLMGDGFDVTLVNDPPEGRHVGHAFTFLNRRLMDGQYIPYVPVMLNTYYPPNQPSVARSYALGVAIRKAIEAWPSDKRVAVAASGGLTHPILDEELDRRVLDDLQRRDTKDLLSLDEDIFRLGTSEIKNWIAVAGAMEESGKPMKVIEYIPAYRSTAGTGCGLAFTVWS